jgi:hypothetical protein
VWTVEEKEKLFICESKESYVTEIPLPEDQAGYKCEGCWRGCMFARFGELISHVFKAEKPGS